jgi:hypothetical protein
MIKENDKLKFDAPVVPYKDFLRAVGAFFGILEEITENLYHSKRVISWSAKVLPGSNMVQALANVREGKNIDPHEVLKISRRGLKLIECEAKWPDHFSEKALEDAKLLSEMSDDKKLPISIVSEDGEQKFTPQITSNIVELFRTTYSAVGTIEGKLQVIAKKDRLYFGVYDEIIERFIHCYFSEDILENAKDAFDRRVAVTGLIHYKTDKTPHYIDVIELYRFPLDIELPHYTEICGILGKAQ